MDYRKVLSIISFVTVMVCLATALISDFVIFKDAILAFIGGIIATVFLFIVLVAAFIASFIFIFGFFLVEEYGFWPLSVSLDAFRDILNDITITSSQISSFQSIRIVIMIILVVTFVLSIIALHKGSDKKPPMKGMSVNALVFSILGIVVGASLLFISSRLL